MTQPSVIIQLASSDLPPPHARDHCKACTCADGYLARYIKTNGQTCIRWVCDWCENYTTSQDLPASVLPPGVETGQLPLRIDRRAPSECACAVCESADVEYHHWAPTALFPEWGHVSGVFLCPDHHREWHDVMRAHGLRWPHELTDAA